MSSLSATDVALFSVFLGMLYAWRRQRRPPFPPGPPGLPLLGNLLQVPTKQEWLTYLRWTRKYNSPIIHFTALGQHFIVLNDARTAGDLFDKRSSKYNDRPQPIMLAELWVLFNPKGITLMYKCSVDLPKFNFGDGTHGIHRFYALRKSVACKPEGEQRSIFHSQFQESAVRKFRPREIEGAHELLRNILEHPAELFQHLRYYPGSLVLSVAYGIKTVPKGDRYLYWAEKANEGIMEAANPHLVEFVPFLKYFPDFLASFKRKAKVWKEWTTTAWNTPFVHVQKTLADPSPDTNIATSLVGMALSAADEKEDQVFHEESVKAAAGAMFEAGSDTTVSAMKWLILWMLRRPDILAAAQKQIDDVVGPDRLPEFADEASLPLVSAIIKETLRWSAFVPLALPHRLTEDDVYEGYFIPKGTIVLGNIWAMLRDEQTWGPDAHEFNPNRFLDASGALDATVPDITQSFGFGRRICPGRYMAWDSMWIAVAGMLATFDIANAVDETGQQKTPTLEHTDGIVM
ncbi:cytochrome P450 [Punctularia strigosozonata HHB-11173 SS5]|uniref:cytochrome P450 n=1 Tax=Punctularia strigosozonata (strain HHB-11173) TaxID=741275 RepID=UPI0004417D41|nr:cytochrome P450 [Punctularia strigosozonata HHB-11173 SS5]EIN11991.1 cytochrome P450 [Punctularia strigosozonata HHB-11173 SS5]